MNWAEEKKYYCLVQASWAWTCKVPVSTSGWKRQPYSYADHQWTEPTVQLAKCDVMFGHRGDKTDVLL